MNHAVTDERYRAIATELIAIEDGRAVLRREYDGACVKTSASPLRLLSSCNQFRTLAEHADYIVKSGKLTDKDSDSIILELKEAKERGLFISLSGLRQHCKKQDTGTPDPAVIDAVGIPTKNRPESAIRCVGSVIAHSTRHQRELDIVVMDDSDNDALLSGLSSIEAPAGITLRYASRAMRRVFVEKLAKTSGTPIDVCAFALLDPYDLKLCTGANRNSLSLDLAGSAVLTIDDDIICRAGRTARFKEGVALMSRPDPTEFEMFRDNASATRAVKWIEDDFFNDHERWLGASLGSRLAKDNSYLHACELDDSMITRLLRHGATTPISMSGVAGDSGTNIPYQFVAAEGLSHYGVVKDRHAYDLARTSRALVRAADRVTLSNHPFLMTTGTGMDLRSMLPPFPPVLRRSDAVFAYLLYLTFPDTYIAHLPHVMEHKPIPDRPPLAPISSYLPRRPFLSELICHAIGGEIDWHVISSDPAERLAIMGEEAQRIAALPQDQFKAFMLDRVRSRILTMSRGLESLLGKYPDSPGYWREDMQRMIDVFSAELLSDDNYIPFDLPGATSDDQRLILARRLIDQYGVLLSHWPAMFAAAQELRRRGVRITEAV